MFSTKGDTPVGVTSSVAPDAAAGARPRAGAPDAAHDDEDLAQLKALGFSSEFRRDMSPWANFSLGFTYLSPVVGIYTVFAFALATAGPPMIWSLLIVGAGQMLVALVFSEVVAQFPVAGGVYPWARRLWGRKWAWMTGWVYMFCLLGAHRGRGLRGGPVRGRDGRLPADRASHDLLRPGRSGGGHADQPDRHQDPGLLRHLRLHR